MWESCSRFAKRNLSYVWFRIEDELFSLLVKVMWKDSIQEHTVMYHVQMHSINYWMFIFLTMGGQTSLLHGILLGHKTLD